MQDQRIGFLPGQRLRIGPVRRGLTAGGIQQKLPQGIQTGHAVKQDDGPFAMINRDFFGIIIRRCAKQRIQRGKIFGQRA